MSSLQRSLTLKDVIVTVFTSVVGGGIFILTVEIQHSILLGSNVFFAYLLAAIPIFLIALCYAVLSSSIAESGSEYLYAKLILGRRIGFITAWIYFLGEATVLAAISLGSATLCSNFFNTLGWPQASGFIQAHLSLLACFLILVFFLINLLGVSLYKRVQRMMFLLLVLGMLVYIVSGLPHFKLAQFQSNQMGGWQEIVQAAAVIFWAYIGFGNVTNVGDEVKSPEKTLPRGILIAVTLITILYLCIAGVTYGVMPLDQIIAAGTVPAISAAFLSNPFVIYLIFTAFIALASDLSPLLFASSRILFALAEDRAIPSFLVRVNTRFQTPHYALGAIALVGILVVLLFGSFLASLLITDIAILFTFTIITFTSFLLKFKRREIYARAKLHLPAFWLIALGGCIFSLALLVILAISNPTTLLFVTAWGLLGGIVYYLKK